MGKPLSKIENPSANVVNEVEVVQGNVNLELIEFCLIIITLLISLNSVLRVYALHNNRLKKKYTSRANDLDRV